MMLPPSSICFSCALSCVKYVIDPLRKLFTAFELSTHIAGSSMSANMTSVLLCAFSLLLAFFQLLRYRSQTSCIFSKRESEAFIFIILQVGQRLFICNVTRSLVYISLMLQYYDYGLFFCEVASTDGLAMSQSDESRNKENPDPDFFQCPFLI